MGVRNVLVVHMQDNSEEHNSTVKEVEVVLKKHNIKFQFEDRGSLKAIDTRNKDLIISVGGDGTFLRASHYILDKTPILGVNSNPSTKEGFFTRAHRFDFDEKFQRILGNKFSLVRLLRLESCIDGNIRPELALNEVYIGCPKAYHVAYYTLKFDGISEEQKSSGVLIGTPAGSHAWIGSAGGEVLPLDSEKFQFVVREPYNGKLTRPSLTKGMFGEGKAIEIESKMKRGVVIIDSHDKEYGFDYGSVIKVQISDKPLNMVYFE